VFEKPQRKSRIELDDKFLNRVVPEILEHAPQLKMTPPPEGGDMMPAFLRINGELRKINADQIAALAQKSSPTRQWEGPFVQLGQLEGRGVVCRPSHLLLQGKEVDRQVHLGFDLAVTRHVPVIAAHAGTVVYADWLGIYGNCIVIDHGMGVQSLYGPSDVVRRQGRRPRDAWADDWPQRFHRPRRRRSRPFHDAGRRAAWSIRSSGGTRNG
jgi:hypothetical protein